LVCSWIGTFAEVVRKIVADWSQGIRRSSAQLAAVNAVSKPARGG
jgi:hypothetical protein